MALAKRDAQRPGVALGACELSRSVTKERQPLSGSEGTFDGDIGYHVVRAKVATMRLFVEHIGAPLSLRPTEYSLLTLLLRHKDMTPKHLAQVLALPAPSLTLLVDRLQERGLVERVRNEADRRSQHICLTLAGRQLTLDAAQRRAGLNARLDQALTPGEKMLLTELLRKVAQISPD
jgi:DNA-binding MarR family transcriptional regulator